GRRRYSPAVHRLGTAWPDSWFVLRLVRDVIDVARVLDDVSEWIFEITKDVVTGAMPSRAPSRIDPMLPQIGNATHHFIDPGDEVRQVIHRRVGCGVEGNVVVLRIAAQERHLFSAPIRHPKSEDVCIEARDALQIRSVVYDVAQSTGFHVFG